MITLTGSIKPLSNTPEGVRNALEYLYRGLYTIGPKQEAGRPLKTPEEVLKLLDEEFNTNSENRRYVWIVFKFYRTKEKLEAERLDRLYGPCPTCGHSRI